MEVRGWQLVDERLKEFCCVLCRLAEKGRREWLHRWVTRDEFLTRIKIIQRRDETETWLTIHLAAIAIGLMEEFVESLIEKVSVDLTTKGSHDLLRSECLPCSIMQRVPC